MSIFTMIVQKTHRNEATNAPFQARSDATGVADINRRARQTFAEQARDYSGRKLRNRILVANLLAWVAIVVAIRLIFF